MKPILEESFVVLVLDVMESGEKKETLENPGGVKILADLGGEKAGLPFYAAVDPSGKKLADANLMPPKNSNIGYPATPEEIVAFEKFLKAAAPKMKPESQTKLIEHLKKNAPKQ
jgi:hypothetical protein